MSDKYESKVFSALDIFRIELPSWGFANTGTRFGKFIQPAAASSIEEKLSDAGEVHLLTGACPTVALHVLWDFTNGVASADEVRLTAQKFGVRPGSINPNTFQDQIYKFGSFGNPDAEVVALVDPSRTVRERLAARFAIRATFGSHEEALDAVPADAMLVASPSGTHARITCDALARGLHVLVEKPLAITLQDADAIVLSACVQMPSLPAVPAVEAMTGKPVITAAIATTYAMLRELNLERVVPGAGALLSGAY